MGVCIAWHSNSYFPGEACRKSTFLTLILGQKIHAYSELGGSFLTQRPFRQKRIWNVWSLLLPGVKKDPRTQYEGKFAADHHTAGRDGFLSTNFWKMYWPFLFWTNKWASFCFRTWPHNWMDFYICLTSFFSDGKFTWLELYAKHL